MYVIYIMYIVILCLNVVFWQFYVCCQRYLKNIPIIKINPFLYFLNDN